MTGGFLREPSARTRVSGDSSPPVPPVVADRWEELLDDARATAAEYRDAGWEPLLVHTGDVTPLADDRFGLDVLAPDDEYDALEAFVDGVTFDTTRVFRATEKGVRFLLVVVEAGSVERAVLVPAYLAHADVTPLRERAAQEGVVHTHVRPLSGGTRVTFTHDDPSLFF